MTASQENTLGESCRRVARHMSREGSPGEPGEFRSCPTVAERVVRKSSQSCHASRTSAQFRPKVDALGHTSSDIGQTCSTCDQICPMMAQFGPTSSSFDQRRPSLGYVIDELWPASTKFGQIWSTCGHIDQNLAQFGEHSWDFDMYWPNLANMWPQTANFGRIFADVRLA